MVADKAKVTAAAAADKVRGDGGSARPDAVDADARRQPAGSADLTALPHPADRAAVRLAGAARHRLARRPGRRADTPVARTAAATYAGSPATDDLGRARRRGLGLLGLPAAGRWREDVARDKRASFADQPYWGRPIAGWGDADAAVLIVGLAPAANGGNRTGRVFTGDRSGDWLFASLHRVGLATQATSRRTPATGSALVGTRMVATVRCAPPHNKPTTAERDTCAPWIRQRDPRWSRRPAGRRGARRARLGPAPSTRSPRAGLRRTAATPGSATAPRSTLAGPAAARSLLLGCYHPSQQNTFTGRLTPDHARRRARPRAAVAVADHHDV